MILQTTPALCKRFIVTLDNDGLAWNWDGQKGLMSPWQVKCIDGIGAGDAFHGTFCIGLLNDLTLHENLLAASAAGALCCTGYGSRTALPTVETLHEFMAGQAKPQTIFF